MVRCSDSSLYTGVTVDINRRIFEHNFTKKGAKYTRSRRPVRVVYIEKFKNRSSAQKKEYYLKSLQKKNKEKLVEEYRKQSL
jgi:putative endonuclease|tara:strand:+ start:21180 stop:21425 length:246 start_codon:yes stop_codon:yes gene_type:complete